MAIDYNSGITSLDTGASDITYTGNQGPKSPDQERQMAFDDTPGFELRSLEELLDEFRMDNNGRDPTSIDDLRRHFYIKYGPQGIAKIDQAVQQSKQSQRMASADPMLQDEYDKYVFEIEEQGGTPMTIEEFRQQAISGMAEGGIARLGYANGQLVQPGPGRPGYAGREDVEGSGYYGGQARAAAASRGEVSGWGGGRQDPEGTGQAYQAQQQKLYESRSAQERQEASQAATQAVENARIKKEFEDKARREHDAQLSFREKLEQDQIKKNKVLALRKMGLMKGLNPFTKVPEWAEDLTEEELLAMASDVQGIKDYGQATYNPNLNPTKQGSGSELLGRVFEGGPFNTGNMNMGGGGGGQGIASQYPYYPQDVHPGIDPTTDPTDPVTDIPVDPIRFASTPSPHDFSGEWFYGADGGRPGYAGGGIADLRQAYGLGKLVKKATKAIGKIAKSPIGKAALIGLGGWGASKMFPGMMPGLRNLWSGSPLPWKTASDSVARTGGLWNWAQKHPFASIAGASALGGLYTGMTQDDEEEPEWLKRWRASKAAADAQFAGISDPSNLQSIRFADGGRTGYKEGGKELSHRAAALRAMYGIRSNAQEGGLMDMGGMEKDYRQEGGFVPIGGQERADDVPARLSKNEFVFTADAVRAAGGGDIDAGAEVMENVMENLEQGGQVSEESQGLEGARDMFATAQRLEGVL